jgi:transcriptional regulator with XRE-family HTH domain
MFIFSRNGRSRCAGICNEQGRHVPDIETLRKIAKVLNVPLSYFFCEDEMSAELVCLFEKLNEKEKAQLIAILRDDTHKSFKE